MAAPCNSVATTKPFTQLCTDFLQWDIKSEPFITKHKSKRFDIGASKGNSRRPKFQLAVKGGPKIRAPFGVKDPPKTEENQTGEPKNSMRKQLAYSLDSQELLDQLRGVDELVIDWGCRNIDKIIDNKPKSDNPDVIRAVVESAYRSLVKASKTKPLLYKPLLNTKVNLDAESRYRTRFFEAEELPGGRTLMSTEKTSDIIRGNSMTVPVIEFSSIWASSGGFGLTVDSTDVMVFGADPRDLNPFDFGEIDEKSDDVLAPEADKPAGDPSNGETMSDALNQGHSGDDLTNEHGDISMEYQPPQQPH
jgi:hypothetical protein